MSDNPTLGPGSGQHRDAARYTVGDLLIDAGRQRVTRGDSVIALPRLSYDLLIALAQAAPNLVSLDALMEQVWPKLVVSPETVSQRVKLLREALGDDARAPRYVEGVRGRGYRLIPLVEPYSPVAAAPSSQASAVTSAAGPPPSEAGPAPSAASELAASVNPPASEAAAAGVAVSARPRSPVLLWGGVIALTLLAGVFVVRQLIRPAPAPTKTSVEVVAPRAVAVLPFDNLSAEPNNDYIALGVADSVLNQLASVPELIVVARSSSFALGKPTPEAREAGRRLGVRYLVTGSVQRAGQVLRVTAQLTDTTSNAALWSLKLDRTIDDVFALQDQIAQRVAEQLNVTLQGRSARYAQYGTDAYLAFLKGRALIESRRVKDVEESVRQFSRAIELAPTFAAALAELVRAKMQLASLQTDPNAHGSAIQPELEALLNRAIQIDPTAGEAYFMRAMTNADQKDPRVAEADFRKGLELAPNFGPGLRDYALYLQEQQQYDAALVQFDRARLVEPLSAENHYYKAELLRGVFLRRDEAAALYLQALSVQPEFYPAYTRLATVRWEGGRLAEAIRYAEKSIAIEPAVDWTRERLIWFYVDAGDLPAARDVLRGHAPTSAEMAGPEALVCYRAGKVETAAKILRKNIRNPEFNGGGYGYLIASSAVIEQSIASHDPSAGRQFILSIPGLKKEGAAVAFVDESFPEVVRLATLEHVVGDQAVASDLAERILKYLDRKPDVHFIGDWDEWARAAASAILGRDDAALSHLESLIQSTFGISPWGRIERDPAFTALRATPRFQAIVSRIRVWLENETQQLEQMRVSGDVPRRSTDQLTANGC
jgi:TolB-like protein/DNA-binding winged helix-turn-helix (wHTH) protein